MKNVARLLNLLLITLIAISCGPGPATNEVPETVTSVPASDTANTTAPATGVSSTKKHIILSLWTQDPLYVQFFGAHAREWAKKYPQYTFSFDFQYIPGQEFQGKLKEHLAANYDIPDLIGINQGAFPNYMKEDFLEKHFLDLTDRIKDDRERFVEARWALYESKGRVYGIESGLSSVIYYYQPELFEKAGVQMPLKTWDDFVKAGEQMNQQGLKIAPLTMDLFFMMFFQRGGMIWDKDGNFVFEQPQNYNLAIKTFEFLQETRARKIWHELGPGDFWGAPIFTAYQNGKVAGAIMPDWYGDQMIQGRLPAMEGKWRIAPLPVWPEGGHKASVFGGTGFAVIKQSPNAELAWDFLRYAYMTKENQINRYLEIHYFPTMKEAIQSPEVLEQEHPYYGGQKIGQVYAESANDVPVTYQSPFRSDFDNLLFGQIYQFLFTESDLTPQQAVDNAIQQFKDARAQSGG